MNRYVHAAVVVVVLLVVDIFLALQKYSKMILVVLNLIYVYILLDMNIPRKKKFHFACFSRLIIT